MVLKGKNAIPDNHLHKDWQRYIRCWFDQPMRKKRRARTRLVKAAKVYPRPVESLRPVVRCPTIRYNIKTRLGRGFTLDELKAAGVHKNEARTIGIAVDHRRKNRSVEAFQLNVQRLKNYRSRLILFPRNPNKPKKGDSSSEERKLATQLTGAILPIKAAVPRITVRTPTEDEKKFGAHYLIRKARITKRLHGKRTKKEQEGKDQFGMF
jgi:large subunit ribosomal protein L13e